jgi:BASS family bile acid:Na+ symporter
MDGLSPEFLQASLVRVAVIVLMVSLGLRVPISAIVAASRQGRAFVAALGVGLVIVPALGWVIVRVLGLPEAVGIGVLLLAAAPGGSLGLKFVDLARGDVALGLGLFFILALVAPFSVPITAALLVGSSGSGASIDVLPLLVTLIAIQLVPLALALGAARLAPRPARRIGAMATTAATVLLVAIIASALALNLDDVLAVGPAGVVAFLAVIGGALLAGFVLGGGAPGVGRAVALLSAQRSGSMALLIATSLGMPAVTGAVVAGGLILLLVNPVVARLLAARRPAVPAGRMEVADRA